MPCYPFRHGNASGFICTGRRKEKPCHYCGKPSTKLCDFPIKRKGKKKKDCDVPMCDNCTQQGVSPDVDFCRAHYPLAKAAYERRQANLQKQ